MHLNVIKGMKTELHMILLSAKSSYIYQHNTALFANRN